MQDFRFVNYLWQDEVASSQKDEVDLLVYRSWCLGSDLRITNFAGGNTSCKTVEPDPITGKEIEILWIKGSGGNLSTLDRSDLATLDIERLRALKRLYRGREHEDEMLDHVKCCIVGHNPVAPSIDTFLHAFLPSRHIDHLHPDSIIALAACRDGKRLVEEIFEGHCSWIDWQRPGFDLGLRLEELVTKQNSSLRGIVLAKHGLISWGETSRDCYENSLQLIERASEFLQKQGAVIGNDRPFGKVVVSLPDPEVRHKKAAQLFPLLRGRVSENQHQIGFFQDSPSILDFLSREKAKVLARVGTSCPDHFLRTKIRPLFLDVAPDCSPETIEALFLDHLKGYRQDYSQYYERNRQDDSPAMRGAEPAIILIPGIGMFSFGRDAATARIAGEFYSNAIHVMRGAEAVSQYEALPENEAFAIEYWKLEEAKLRRMPNPKPLQGKIAFVTGGAGGIGLSTAHRFLKEGACVIIADINRQQMEQSSQSLAQEFGLDRIRSIHCDVADPLSVQKAFEEICLFWGGLDILVNNAGIALSKSLEETTPEEYDRQNQIMPRGSFLCSQQAARIMCQQNVGGDIVYVASKNALCATPNSIAYSTAKAAQLHQMRLLAAELAQFQIRVNAVNPEAVVKGSGIFSGGWGASRAKAYGVKEEDLGQFYAQRTLLKKEILPEDIAAAIFVLVGYELRKSTGLILNVDSGFPPAMLR